MKTEHALRYLLLRHLERFRAVVPRDRFHAVVRSLRVEADREGWLVRWSEGDAPGAAHERRFPRGAFAFYARGDRGGASDVAQRNDAAARAFAEDVFGCAAPPLAPERASSREPYRGVSAGGALVLGAALFAAGLDPVSAVGVAAWLLVEHLPAGRLLACAPLLLLAAAAFPPAALLGALAAVALQALDPDPRARLARILLCAAAAAIAAWRVPQSGAGIDPLAVLAFAAATVLSAWRSLLASHFRAAPLALPLLLAGLAFGGPVRAAWLGLALVAVGNAALARLHRIRPVRHDV